jgi:hypothetical protein
MLSGNQSKLYLNSCSCYYYYYDYYCYYYYYKGAKEWGKELPLLTSGAYRVNIWRSYDQDREEVTYFKK